MAARITSPGRSSPTIVAKNVGNAGATRQRVNRTFSGKTQAGKANGKDTDTTTMADVAVGLAAKYGWKIFPARMEDGKKWSWLSGDFAPGHERWGQTNDVKQLKKNFNKKKWRMECGIGVPTGADNGIIVIEGDTKKGHAKLKGKQDGLASIRELESKLGRLPDTLMAQSPTGSVHRYFKHPGEGYKINKIAFAVGVDVKGDGGMVIAPPSVRAGVGAYRWLNDLPIAELPEAWRDALATERTDTSSEEEKNFFGRYGDSINKSLDEFAAALAVVPNTVKTGRPHWIDIGHAIKHEYPGEEGKQLWLEFSKKWDGVFDGDEKKYNTDEKAREKYLIKTWNGIKPDGRITGKTVYYHAYKADPNWHKTFKAAAAVKAPTHNTIVMVCAADVKMRPMEWLWEGHLLRGALELTTGLPGLGKSQVQIHLMACASAGLPWPDGAPAIEPVNVVMVTAEDALDTIVVPRLSAAGADRNRVRIIKCIKTDKQQRQFLLAEDLMMLEQAVKQIGNVGLICIDPITAYMGGKMDSHKATEVRSQLGPLKDFSERTNVAVSAITHPAKNASARAIDHFIGSQAFIAATRIGHASFEEIEVDEETGEKTPTGRFLFTNVKYSAHRKMPTLAYKIEEFYITPEPFVQINTTRVVWEKEAVNTSAEQAIAVARSIAKGKATETASSDVMNFLRMMLDNNGGWCKQTEIAAQGKALGFSDKELRTARDKLAIVLKKDGYQGPWVWGWKDGKRPLRF
jgi:putative DNA primase/helicase